MSDLMLHGVLNMPLPDDPTELDLVTWVQFRDRARQASDHIEELEAKLAKAVEAMSQAHILMRECGWHLAPAIDPQEDGVLNLAVAEVEEKFGTTLAELKGETYE